MTESVRASLLIIVVLIVLLTLAALLIWLERRLLALWQDRYGPNRVGPFGLLADASPTRSSCLTKEDWIPPFADKPVFVLAPAVIMVTVLMSFAVVPFAPGMQRRRSQHRPAVLPRHVVARRLQRGAGRLVVEQQVRAARRPARRGADAQLRGLHGAVADGRRAAGRLVQPRATSSRRSAGSGSASRKSSASFVFLIAGVAETHRLPFDLPEAESEIVAGYHSEYSGMKFGMFFVGEYLGVTLISAMIVTLFFGGWLGPVASAHRLVRC